MEITERFTGFTSRPKRFFFAASGPKRCRWPDCALWVRFGRPYSMALSRTHTMAADFAATNQKKILRVYQHSIHAKYIYQGQLNRYTMPALIYHCLLGISVDRSLFRCTAAALIWLGDRRKDPRDKPSTISRGLQPLFSLDIFHHNHLLLSIPSCH